MVLTELSLPIDIPWKRMGFSRDMIDEKAGDLQFPEKWRSSIAAFYHEPTELPPDYCNRKITYLKIVCTLTNFQDAKSEDVTVLDEMRSKFKDFYAWKFFDALVTNSYPCYGALLQVGVYPHSDDDVELHDYPYIASFQPRKREMYEVLTESGEVASQSANRLNVLKGTTSSQTVEEYDLDMGGGGGSAVFGLGSGTAAQKQEGKVKGWERQDQNLTTADASREKRESYSYNTSINQLYSLLQGYHLGTNRAMFFMQPRPHIQDPKFTFVRGPRRLEGIQEFFFIINRPASVAGICVEVALETAHAYLTRTYQPRIIPLSDLYADPSNLEKTADALGINLNVEPYATYARRVNVWNSLAPGFRLDMHLYVSTVALKGTAAKELGALIQNRGAQTFLDAVWIAANVPGLEVGEVVLVFEEYEADSGNFFVTGRRLCSCTTPAATGMNSDERSNNGDDCEISSSDHISTCDDQPSIVYETVYAGLKVAYNPYKGPVDVARAEVTRSSFTTGTLPSLANPSFHPNRFIEDVNRALSSSLGSPNRLPYGEGSFLETEFMLDELSQLIRLLRKAEAKDRDIAKVKAFEPLLEQGLGKVSGVKTLLELGDLSTKALARDLDLGEVETRKVRREILISALRSVDGKTINVDAERENPIVEKFVNQFPKERLRKLEHSAGVAVKAKPPKTGK